MNNNSAKLEMDNFYNHERNFAILGYIWLILFIGNEFCQKFFDNFWNFRQFLKILNNYWNFWNFWQFLKFSTIFEIFDNFWTHFWNWKKIWNFRHFFFVIFDKFLKFSTNSLYFRQFFEIFDNFLKCSTIFWNSF